VNKLNLQKMVDKGSIFSVHCVGTKGLTCNSSRAQSQKKLMTNLGETNESWDFL